MLREQGCAVNRKRMHRPTQLAIAALGPKLRTSKPAPGHKIFPYCCATLPRAVEPGVGARTSPRSRSAVTSSTSWRSWTGRVVRCWRGGCPTPWTVRSASRRRRRRWRASERRIPSTPTRGSQFTSADFTSAPVAAPAGVSRWTDAGAAWTTCSSNECDARSSTRTRLRGRPRGAQRHRCVVCVLQYRAPTSGARPAHANGGVAPRRHRWISKHSCGHDAALGRRSRVAHMPTAAATRCLMCQGSRRSERPGPLVPPMESTSEGGLIRL
jgi:hypothetical protein